MARKKTSTAARGVKHEPAPRGSAKPLRRAALPARARASVSQPAGPAHKQARGRERTKPPAKALRIVGIGASAGGLDAITQVLDGLPPDTGMAFVCVQHLDPGHASALPELLSRATKMRVVQAAGRADIAPNCVYVVPPNGILRIEDGRLHVLPRPEDRTGYMPIDIFLRSLAEHAQGRAIGVILSGTGTDGTAGLREIKAQGGITLVEDPKLARYDGMPRAAVSADVADKVLSPREIAAELARISRIPVLRAARARSAGDGIALNEEHLPKVFSLLRLGTGVDFAHYKLPTIRRRLQRRMVLHKLATLSSYVKLLQSDPEEVQALYRDILIHVTHFFRDPESFKALSEVVFPAIMKDRTPNEPVRIWVPGCSTGEEAYSIVIALLEYLGERADSTSIQLFATDLSESAVEHGRAGIYPGTIQSDLSPERLRRFFSKTDGSYRVNKVVRDACIFARQDVTRDPPFSKLDLIVCRNVLIYLSIQLQKRLMNTFHYALNPRGFLMLGAAETIGPSGDLFEVADKKHRIYAKKSAARARAEVGFHAPIGETGRPARKEPPLRPVSNVHQTVNRLLLDRYAPPAVVVDHEFNIIQFHGQTGPFIEPAPGEATLNVLKMLREGLLHGVQAALHDARRRNAPAQRAGLRVRGNGKTRGVSVEAIPLPEGGRSIHYLVTFSEAAAPEEAAPEKKPKGRGGKRVDGRVRQLEEELAGNREYLQSIIQDLEAANEELQSANEEVLSSNEELQSTNEELDTAKEELQSTNEELNTVNEELHGRNEELSRANSDLVNLLGSVQIAIVMVSADLRIRRFTPMAEKLLNLIPGDIGRPISNIKPDLELEDLGQMITESIDKITIQEAEVRDRLGNWYSLRVRPYKNLESKIDGAVLVLFDINAARRHEVACAKPVIMRRGFFRPCRRRLPCSAMTSGSKPLIAPFHGNSGSHRVKSPVC